LVRQAVEGNMQENTLLTIFPNGKGHESDGVVDLSGGGTDAGGFLEMRCVHKTDKSLTILVGKCPSDLRSSSGNSILSDVWFKCGN
jgi:hypothetical protein